MDRLRECVCIFGCLVPTVVDKRAAAWRPLFRYRVMYFEGGEVLKHGRYFWALSGCFQIPGDGDVEVEQFLARCYPCRQAAAAHKCG